ncbi:MAG: response regulator transcription factor [Anaerolineales bacterium]|nr:response regulator transcription factor [Anaerolineales bacterium]
MTKQTILVVDDEAKIVNLLRAYLEDAGYRVVTAGDGREALFAARHEKPDLIILDLMMPEMDGWEFTRRFRQESNTPIIMLTARVEDVDKIVGLEMGADDYVVKPFSPREIVARVRAVLRRGSSVDEPLELLRAGDLVLDREAHEVKLVDKPVDLTPTEFGLLTALMERPGRAMSRLELLDAAQGDAYEGYERTVDVHIKNIRRKIESDPANPQYILTVFGVGYKFNDI